MAVRLRWQYLRLLFLFPWLVGGSVVVPVDAVGEEEVKILSDQPLSAAETDKSLYLYSEDTTLGTPQAPKKIIEGIVRTGKYHVIPLPVGPEIGIKPEEWRLYLIELPFTLDKAPGEKSYEKLVFWIRLNDEAATAYDLFPPSVVEERKQSLKFGLSPKLKFQWFDVGADLSYQREFTVLKPKITVYDVGRSKFGWEYEGTSTAPILPGNRYALIVLEVPSDVTRVRGEIQAEAVIQKGPWDFLQKVPTLSNVVPIEWILH